MKYIEVEIRIKPEHVESLLNELSIAGITDAVINNPVEIADIVSNLGDTEWYDAEQVAEDFLAGRGHESEKIFASVTLYCDDDEAGRERVDLVKRVAQCCDDASVTVRVRDDSEWKDAWKEYYHTARVSDRFVVKPTWEDVPSDLISEDLFVIEIDPGMAFGTGTHETTSLSLRLMEKYVEPGDKVLDVGTGSGILAIAAAKLGASDVLGIDIDEDAVGVANENINNNLQLGAGTDVKESAGGTVPIVRAIVGDLTKGIDYKADVVVANLLADLVIKLTSSVEKHMNPNAVYITSGILVEKRPLVEECLAQNGFTVIETMTDGEWCAIAAKCSA